MISVPDIVKSWTLDFRKMARPERSGVAANLLVYALLWLWGYQFMPHDFGDDFNLKCYLMPWECPKEKEFSKPEIERRYHVILLGPGKGEKKACSCHFDIWFKQWAAPKHFHSSFEEDCESHRSVGHLALPEYWVNSGSIISCPEGAVCSQVKVVAANGEEFFLTDEDKFRVHCE